MFEDNIGEGPIDIDPDPGFSLIFAQSRIFCGRLIFSKKGRQKKNINYRVKTVDIAPTILSLLGISIVDSTDGKILEF